MLHPKFIIVDDNETKVLILMKVSYHKEILERCEPHCIIKGGGFFKINVEEKTLTFYGESADFGKPTFENIKECCDNNNIYTSPYYDVDEFSRFKGWNFIYESYNI